MIIELLLTLQGRKYLVKKTNSLYWPVKTMCMHPVDSFRNLCALKEYFRFRYHKAYMSSYMLIAQ